jgi:hypothetical protein
MLDDICLLPWKKLGHTHSYTTKIRESSIDAGKDLTQGLQQQHSLLHLYKIIMLEMFTVLHQNSGCTVRLFPNL